MIRKIATVLLGLCWVGCQYGPKQDYSRFDSAALIQNGRTVVFTFHERVYRPAKGLAAFPDGGIPKYILDRSLVGTYDRTTGDLKKHLAAKNREWTHGSGNFHIVTARGNAVLVSQSGQKRSDLSAFLTRYHLFNLSTGAHDTFDLKRDLEKYGRRTGFFYLADDNGTLVVITTSLTGGEKMNPPGDEIPEIWVRRPGGRYLFAGASAHYQETANGEVIYWTAENRRFYAFDIENATTRQLAGYRTPEARRTDEGVSVASAGDTLEIGIRDKDGWHYQPLPVDIDRVRKL